MVFPTATTWHLGRIFANELMSGLGEELTAFIDNGGYAIGICNGFQVLVKAGLLPRLDGKAAQSVTLTHNSSGRYEDRWVRCQAPPLLAHGFPKTALS